jgi:hypothetical protein
MSSAFATAVPDERDLQLDFGLLLRDPVTRGAPLPGTLEVRLAGWPDAPRYRPLVKEEQGVVLFFGLPAGTHVFEVRCSDARPFYKPVDITATLPFGTTPRWPVFPDIGLADLALMLDDPTQPLAYRTQRKQAELVVTSEYPGAADVTLLRGTVMAGGVALANALVTRTSDGATYTTGSDGQYVLNFPTIVGSAQNFAIKAEHSAHLPVSQIVRVARDTTTLTDFILA